ncbi:MAG: SixA phosphatase family protein [Actinomycetes bacterium]
MPEVTVPAARHVLLLMRHAKAASPEGVPDRRRPLADRGRRDAAATGEWLSSAGLVPDAVVCSDAVRARETADLVVEGIGSGAPAVEDEPDLYEASVHRVLHVVAGTPEDVGTLLVVGHEPTTSATVAALTRRDVSFPTSAVAVIDVDRPWKDVASGAGRLRTVHTPKG